MNSQTIVIDTAALWIFTLELLLKLRIYGARFFKEGWNLFDLTIVTIGWIRPPGRCLSCVRFASCGYCASMFSLFQIMTLESWSMGIVRPVMNVYPNAWAFFVPLIIITSFTVLNLFNALIVNSMQILNAETKVEPHEEADVAHS